MADENIESTENTEDVEIQDGEYTYDVSLEIDINLPKKYSGMLKSLTETSSAVTFTPTDDMRLDDSGLIHSAFLMSAVEYAVHCVINSKNTYIQSVKAEYLAPLEANNTYTIDAKVMYADKKKKMVFVKVTLSDIVVFDAEFNVLSLDEHILDVKLNEK